jgi:peptide/nickel transport system substrate-binding protein
VAEPMSGISTLLGRRIARRVTLGALGGGAVAALLAACGAQAPSPTAAPAKPTTAPAAPAATAAPAAATKPAAATTAPAAATTVPAAAPTAAAKPAATGGALTPVWGATLAHINPLQQVTNAQAQYHATVFSSLMQANPDKTRMEPELAEMTAAPDASSYTFKLNPRAKWHDGKPLTTADVAFTYTLALTRETKSNRLSRLSMIKGAADFSAGKTDKVAGIVVLDDQTIRFDMEFPNALFLIETDLAIMPKHILGTVAPADLEKHPFMFESPVGSGPFKAVKNTSDVSSEVAANPDFYRGRPRLDKITFRIVKQADAAQIALERGEVDFNAAPTNFINIAPDALSRFLAQPNLFMVRMPNPVQQIIGWNQRQEHWKDKRVRQAFIHAIDRKKIIDSLLGGNAEVVNTPIVHPFVGFKPKNDYPYDPNKAKQLLSEAKWDMNREVTVMGVPATSDTDRSLRAAVQAQLAAVGIKSKWEERESSVFVKAFYQEHTFDMVYVPGTTFADPALFLDFHFATASQNAMGYASPALDQMLDKGKRARTPAERAEIYKTIGDQFNEEVPWGSLWSVADTNIFNRRVNIPFLQPPAGPNPKTAAEVPFSTVRALFTWFYRVDEWGVRA